MARRKRRSDDDPARPQGQRQLRVGEELRHVMAQFLRPGELRDPALRDANVTVTEVRLSPDLRNATVFVMPLAGANAADVIAGLRRGAPYLRSRLGHLVEMRRTPNLVFVLDRAFDRAERIAALLSSPTVERDLHSEIESDDGAG